MLEVEEGLASIHTALRLPINELWFPAILYIAPIFYSQARCREKTIQKLLHYCDNRYFCSRLVDRATDNLGYHDQAYLMGSIDILKNYQEIDFPLLMCGKLLP